MSVYTWIGLVYLYDKDVEVLNNVLCEKELSYWEEYGLFMQGHSQLLLVAMQ